MELLQFRLGWFLVLADDRFRGFAVRAGLGDGRRSIVGRDVGAPGFVGVQGAGEFAVGSVDVVVVGGWWDGEEGVESGIGAFGFLYLIAEAEDFVVLWRECVLV